MKPNSKAGRPKGLPKTGGRVKGTPNKDNPLKVTLKNHSSKYFSEVIEELDKDGNPTGRVGSQYELDLLDSKPSDRINAELMLLKFHTPQMQATAIDVAMSEQNAKLSDRLERLSNGEDIPSDEG